MQQAPIIFQSSKNDGMGCNGSGQSHYRLVIVDLLRTPKYRVERMAVFR